MGLTIFRKIGQDGPSCSKSQGTKKFSAPATFLSPQLYTGQSGTTAAQIKFDGKEDLS